MSKKIMILGASILQVPAIKKAKQMGLYVICVDMNPNAIGFEYSDEYYVISTTDTEKVLALAIKKKIDAIMTLASDRPMITVATVGEKLGLNTISFDTAIKATNKCKMRNCLLENNVPIPKFYKIDDYKEYESCVKNFSGKFIVKPSDNSGSRGIFLVDTDKSEEYLKYVFEESNKQSYCGQLIIEEYMYGQEVSVEAISYDGEVNIITITDKITTGAPHFVEMGHSQPSNLNQNIKKEIEKLTISAIKAIGIKYGPSHTEIIITSDGPKIVEIGARLGGDNITTHLVPYSTGIDMVSECIKISLGNKPNCVQKYNKAAAIRYFDVKEGKILKIDGVNKAEKLKNVRVINFMKDIGSKVSTINNSSDRVGFVIAQAEDVLTALDTCYKVEDIISIKMER